MVIYTEGFPTQKSKDTQVHNTVSKNVLENKTTAC